MRLTSLPLLSLSLLCAAATGCGEDGTSFTGIYEASYWTENEMGCDMEGPSVLEQQSETFFYIKNNEFFGEDFVSLSSCRDQADCEVGAGEPNLFDLSGAIFETGSDDEGWTGESFIGSSGPDDLCEGVLNQFLLLGSDAGVRVETRRVPVSGVPRDSDGFCDFDAAKAQATMNPCGQLEVFEGVLIAPLP